MNELWRLDATKIAALVKSRQVSAHDVATAALERLSAVNPSINAVVDIRPEDVLAQAGRIDAAIAHGEEAGALAGVPVTVKVNVDQRGYATTNGATLQKDLLAADNSPVVDSLLEAGAMLLGRTNTPAFSYRWFTNNRLHGHTKNPHDPTLTPGGSSGGAAAAVASGIGSLAHGTDIAGSIRYPAYACGIHGLRPSPGRVAAYNASSPERDIVGQITAVSGPLARSIDDLRVALKALSRRDARDPWWTPAPLTGPEVARRAALCLDPGKIGTCEPIRAKLRDAARHLEAAGWIVEEVGDLPPLREAAELQTRLWIGEGYEAKLAAAEKEGDPGAFAVLRGHQALGRSTTPACYSQALTRRATLIRQWQLFMETYPVVLLPVSADLPFEDDLDLKGQAAFERVWEAQIPQIGVPFLGLPGLSVFTGLTGRSPTGVQLLAPRFREDLCLAAGAVIEAAFGPPSVVDPAGN
ncbi:amidase family protein [Labrys sp. LIt4]|uniref:amidase family protein n=1 Tax=Labrys sp. LIt4 TaxID=2821355 RepID=UPI001ADF1472|nr:amidase family protein [Labrys sp. LIt4]MBP0580694.1 amidase family protein [Labrys sp. LIt4]